MNALIRQAVAAALIFGGSGVVFANQAPEATAEAPADSDVWETRVDGTFFVKRVLKQRYEKLKSRIASFEGLGNAPAEPRDQAELRAELNGVRELIEKSKVFVTPFQIRREKKEATIELGPNRLVIVTGDRVKIVGWDQPEVKYVLERVVLSAQGDDQEEVDGVVLKHEHRLAPEMVGRTEEERRAEEEKYLAGPAGSQLTPEQLAQRARVVEQIASGYRHFTQFQGQEIDILELTGLTHQQGNRQISYRIRRPEGGGQVGSVWRRHAELTLYMPKCSAILVRGCQSEVNISGVQGDVILTSQGSRQRDYAGEFVVRDIRGRLTIDNVPMDLIENVEGNVVIESTTEMVNSGSSHRGDSWTQYTASSRSCSVQQVEGDFTGHFVRSDLSLSDISGVVNVENEYGDTSLILDAEPADGSHRVVSYSGRIRLELGPDVEPKAPLFAATNCGTLVTNLGRRDIEDLNMTHTSEYDGERRGWRVFHSPVGRDFEARFRLYRRPDLVTRDLERPAGVDIISRAGTVELVRQDTD